MTASEKKYHEIAASLAESDGAVSSQMFGMPALKIGGKAFAGLLTDAIVFKLTGEAHTRALALPDAKLFEPMTGRPMKEWVVVPVINSKEWPALAREAMEYCATLKK
jgi:hypothetical protein